MMAASQNVPFSLSTLTGYSASGRSAQERAGLFDEGVLGGGHT